MFKRLFILLNVVLYRFYFKNRFLKCKNTLNCRVKRKYKTGFSKENGLFVLAFLSTAAGLIVHVSTFLLSKYPDPDFFSMLFGLLVIVLLTAILSLIMVIMSANAQSRQESENTSANKTTIPINTSGKLIPKKNKLVNTIIGLCFFYVVFNFFVWFPYDGLPHIIDGKYVLSNHRIIRAEITEDVYYERKFREIRLISVPCMFFSMIPMFYFYLNLVKINDQNKRQTIE
jgi:hypothetical protein